MKLRITSLILALLMLFCAVPTAAAQSTAAKAELDEGESFRYTQNERAYEEIPLPVEIPAPDGALLVPKDEKYLASYDYSTEYAVLKTLERDIVAAMKPGSFSVNVASYNIDPNRINLYNLKNYSPYIANGIEITPYYYAGGYYTEIRVNCSMNRYELESYYAKVDAAIEDANEAVERANNVLERTLMLHDYLAYSAEYDAERLDNGTMPDDSYRCAGVLVHKIGVCQSYAYAYKYILDGYGIETDVVTSKAMNHAWNVVKIDSAYYHVDVTWDDPTPDRFSRVDHDYFLLSDSAMRSARGQTSDTHHGWDSKGKSCSDTRYDNAYWYGISSPIHIFGDYRYFISERYLVRRQAYTGEQVALDTFGYWYTIDKSAYWNGVYSGLSYYRGRLFYNNTGSIKYIDLSSGAMYTAKAQPVSPYSIFASKIIGDRLYYTVSDSPNNRGTTYEANIYDITSIVTLTVNCDDILLWEGESLPINVVIKNLSGTDYVNYTINNSNVMDIGDGWNIIAKSAGGTRVKLTYGDSEQELYVYVLNSSKLFRDVKNGSWFRRAVDYAVKNGLMNGTSHYDFEPNISMNRAMLVTVLWRMAGSPEPRGNTPFGDLKQSWYKKAVAWAYENGIVNGISTTSFGPAENITREQMAAIFYRYSAFRGYNVSQSGNISAYPDAGKVSKYAVGAMSWANGAGLIKGQSSAAGNRLNPRGEATRAEVATILERFAAIAK